jgi:hypothetical protein
MSLAKWSASRVLLLGITWVFAALVFSIWRVFAMLPNAGGVAAVSTGLVSGALLILGPPLLLVLAWLAARRSTR